jgi:hypothetical protein
MDTDLDTETAGTGWRRAKRQSCWSETQRPRDPELPTSWTCPVSLRGELPGALTCQKCWESDGHRRNRKGNATRTGFESGLPRRSERRQTTTGLRGVCLAAYRPGVCWSLCGWCFVMPSTMWGMIGSPTKRATAAAAMSPAGSDASDDDCGDGEDGEGEAGDLDVATFGFGVLVAEVFLAEV